MKILVWRNKYDDAYYDASTPEALEASARMIVTELVETGWIPEPDEDIQWEYTGIDLELAKLTDEQIASLPAEALRRQAAQQRSKYLGRLRDAEKSRLEYENALKLSRGETVTYEIKHGDEVKTRELTAWQFLQARNGAEYEDYDVHTVWTEEDNK